MSNNNEWTSLPNGSLQRFAANTPASRQAGKLRTYTFGAGGALLLAAVVAGFSLLGDGLQVNTPAGSQALPVVGSLTCSEATSMFESYHNGRLGDVKKHLLEDHLDYCGTCQAAYSQQFSVSASAVGNPIVAAIFTNVTR